MTTDARKSRTFGERPSVVRRSGIVAADGAHAALDSDVPPDVAPAVPPTRAPFRSSRAPTPPTSRSSSSLQKFDAKRVFQAARLCAMQGREADAMLLVGQLCALHPEQVQYLALHAWLRVVGGELRDGPTGDAILSTLNRAVSERRDDLEIRLYRARVFQRLGRAAEAFRDFSFVANANPSNTEAAREVRAYDAKKANGQ